VMLVSALTNDLTPSKFLITVYGLYRQTDRTTMPIARCTIVHREVKVMDGLNFHEIGE